MYYSVIISSETQPLIATTAVHANLESLNDNNNNNSRIIILIKNYVKGL